jgi:rfaE bifunctional protein nucleotidyltransferase chain/domain
VKATCATIFRSVAQVRKRISDVGAQRVVLANGCFDPLHVGHVRYLYGARAHGDFLVVALNDDRSTRALKGEGRPVMAARDRAKLLSALDMVDAVVLFSSRDVTRILRKLRPDVHAKGTDYERDTVPERETSQSLGIDTVIVGDPKAHASREIVERIRRGRLVGE